MRGCTIEEREGGEIVFSGDKINSAGYDGPLWPFLKQRMQSHGVRTAFVNPYDREEFSYARVLSVVERLARGLRKLGLREGKSLCILAPNSVENALLILATMSAGGVLHAINPASMTDEIRRQLDLTEAGFIVTVQQFLAPVQQAVSGSNVRVIIIGQRNGILNYSDLLTLGSDDVTLPTTFGDPGNSVAAILFSSGTTGVPKGVEITQRNMRAWIHIFSMVEGGTMQADDVVLLFLPFFHVYGQVVTLLTSLATGCKIVVMEKFDMLDFLSFAARYKSSVLFLVPPVVIGMLNFPKLSDYDLSSVRFAVCGAAPLGKDTEAQFIRTMGVPCLQGYGMTENMVAGLTSLNKYKAGSCGFPLPNMEFKIVDSERNRCLGVKQAGDLYMRGPMTMRGYLKNPQATTNTIDSKGWLNTGDVGLFDSDGFLYIVDRKKELIKYKGEQVPPAVLEDVLLNHPGIADACVVGRPDPVAGELPMAFVVTAPGHTLTAQQVQDFVAKNVPSFMQLRGGVEFREQIPKSPSGKILRRLLRDELKQKVIAKL
ncbi:uncharacterized protein [Littorina saxatilis]|uniref:Uncharacterized protein n=1 Tax=Littorina saxatilis TaxID=31220 RepID=A0AAN9AQT5_9CAEN